MCDVSLMSPRYMCSSFTFAFHFISKWSSHPSFALFFTFSHRFTFHFISKWSSHSSFALFFTFSHRFTFTPPSLHIVTSIIGVHMRERHLDCPSQRHSN